MDFASAVIFLALYYLRPQEWTEALSQFRVVQVSMAFSIFTIIFRDRGFQPGQLLRTPHDWSMLAFFLWIVLTSTSPLFAFAESLRLFIFYIVIVQVLTTIPRIISFCGWWTFLIIAVAAIALAPSVLGIDPFDSARLTNSHAMVGRLVLNFSIFRNPNALGHSIVPCIPMLYYFCVWKRPLFLKELAGFIFAIPLYCLYLTYSKGSFISGSIAMLLTGTFGRPRKIQILILALGITFGTSAIYLLPRMSELENSKKDPAIQGRVAAFRFGLQMIRTKPTGVGYGNWMKAFRDGNSFSKAAHSSYVQTGTELGFPGFFLFLLNLYCCLRTLITAKTQNDEEERIRRTLFLLVVTYMASSWMVDFGYRPTFFMFCAAIAAFHRHLHGMYGPNLQTPEAQPFPQLHTAPQLRPALVLAQSASRTSTLPPPTLTAPDANEDPEIPVSRIGGSWNRIGLYDLLIVAVMTYAFAEFWAYMIIRM